MDYLLVRHGESLQNIGVAMNVIDAKVGLSQKGMLQTEATVKYIMEYAKSMNYNKINVVFSPYERTRIMADELKKAGLIARFREEPLVSEIQCGDFEGYTFDQYKELYPSEYEKICDYKKNGARFWYKYRNGESPFDVNIRSNLFLMKMLNNKSDLIIVISHLFFLKTLEMNLLEENLDWFEKQKSFNNAEIHIIHGGKIVYAQECKIS